MIDIYLTRTASSRANTWRSEGRCGHRAVGRSLRPPQPRTPRRWPAPPPAPPTPAWHQTRPHPVHRDDGPHHADETVADRRYDDW